MRRSLALIFFVLLDFSLATYNPKPLPCEPCPESESPFCVNQLNPGTCECQLACCSLAPCPINTERRNCQSCDCPCEPIVCPECPSTGSPFCSTTQDPETCDCLTSCCALEQCQPGFSRNESECTSCDCPCTFDPNTCNPCETPQIDDGFCKVQRRPGSCECDSSCCKLPPCKFGAVRDFSTCNSCDDPCPCLILSKPPIRTPPKQKTSKCNLECPPSSSTCKVSLDQSTCTCKTSCCTFPKCPKFTKLSCSSCFDQCICLPFAFEDSKKKHWDKLSKFNFPNIFEKFSHKNFQNPKAKLFHFVNGLKFQDE
jgi:hypothetical protein